jgi:hypothetical protein
MRIGLLEMPTDLPCKPLPLAAALYVLARMVAARVLLSLALLLADGLRAIRTKIARLLLWSARRHAAAAHRKLDRVRKIAPWLGR